MEACGSKPTAPFTYLPFGGGPRFCIGVVMVQVKMMLARLIQRFDFQLLSPEVGQHLGATLEPRGLKLKMAARGKKP